MPFTWPYYSNTGSLKVLMFWYMRGFLCHCDKFVLIQVLENLINSSNTLAEWQFWNLLFCSSHHPLSFTIQSSSCLQNLITLLWLCKTLLIHPVDQNIAKFIYVPEDRSNYGDLPYQLVNQITYQTYKFEDGEYLCALHFIPTPFKWHSVPDPCCALKYYPEIEACVKVNLQWKIWVLLVKTIYLQEIDGQIESERKYIERLTVEDFGPTKVGKIRKFLWNLTEYPETSLGARVIFIFNFPDLWKDFLMKDCRNMPNFK